MCQLDNKGHATEYKMNTEPFERMGEYISSMRFYTPSTGRAMYTHRMYD